MKGRNRAAALAAAALALWAAGGAMAQKKGGKCPENPVFQSFPGSQPRECEHAPFGKLRLRQAKDPAKPGQSEAIEREGEYWEFSETFGKARPHPSEVIGNFENAVKQGGGTIIGREGARRFFFRIERPSGEYWGQTSCSGSPTECSEVSHKIVRSAEMKQSVVLSADQIRQSIAETGKVAFYGIHFDTGKAVLKPESEPTLAEMAKFLKANGSTRVYVVGHTDDQGGLEHNQKLSRDRAAAVVAALTGSHGIARDRLLADGVGPLAPVARNDNEAGRAKNRRVEMVLRLGR